MFSHNVTDPSSGSPQLKTWRTTTAIRVFAMALATGTVISDRAVGASAPILVVLALLATVSALMEWMVRGRSTHWHAVGEAIAVTALVAGTDSVPSLGAYLAVPAVVAGVRHGLVTVLNVTLLSAVTVSAILALDPSSDSVRGAALALPSLTIGLGVGLLASWQSRSTRDLAARQAPYAATHQLMARLHQLASSGALGLDTATLATELDLTIRRSTGAARCAVFVLEGDGQLRTVLAGADAVRLAAEINLTDAERTPGAAVVPLRGSSQILGYCVLTGVDRWTAHMTESANEVADDFALRLDTAVLFDEIRHLSAAEERTRIARDMHDGVAQEIVALGYLVDEIESVSKETETLQLAGILRDEISRVVTELRHSIFDLRHRVDATDLATALTEYVQEVSRVSEIRVHLVLDNVGSALPSFAQGELMRVAQEAISNVRRHAQAANLWVTLVVDGSAIRLEVADDGVGDAQPRDRHWGLQTMQERARGLGADLTIGPRDGGGTVVQVRTSPPVPHRRSSHHEHHSPAH